MPTERMPEEEVKAQAWICPACGTRALVDHCPSRTCTWHRCRNTVCDLQADLKRGNGHRLGTDSRRIRWVK